MNEPISDGIHVCGTHYVHITEGDYTLTQLRELVKLVEDYLIRADAELKRSAEEE